MPASDEQDGGSLPAPEAHAAACGHSMWRTIVLAALHAVLFLIAFPPVSFFPAALVAPAPLAWLAINARSTPRAVLTVLVTQFMMWLWLSRWMIDVTGLGYPALALYMSLYTVLFTWIVRRAAMSRIVRRWPMTAIVPISWVAMEFLRGTVVAHGYPWFLLAHPLVEWPVLVQSADLAGAYFVSLLAAMVSGFLVDLVRISSGQQTARLLVGCAAAVFAVHGANLAYGLWRTGQEHVLRPGPTMLVVQTNLPQSNKTEWSPDQQLADFQDFFEQTILAARAERAAGRRPDLIIWPETMLPGMGLEEETTGFLSANSYWPGDLFSAGIAMLAERLETPLLVGSPAFLGLRVEDGDFQWDRQYNSAYLVAGRPPYQRYDKIFLTPFGETMPYISAWPWLEERLLALGAAGMSFDLDSNPNPALIEVQWDGAALAVLTPICFEDTVAEVCRSMVHGDGPKRRAVLVNLSNDGWFGSYDAGRRQHAQMARFRCIENRVPMIRAANTGLSLAIDSNGVVIGRIGEGRYGEARQPGALTASTRLDERRSVYGHIGDSWAWICPIGAAGILALSFSRAKQRRD